MLTEKNLLKVLELSESDSALVLTPHPDDPEILFANLLMLISRTHQVHALTLTHGEMGQDFVGNGENLGVRRGLEHLAAMQLIGIKPQIENLPDAYLSGSKWFNIVGQVIKDYLLKHKPAVVLTFSPDGIYGHPDHIAIAKWGFYYHALGLFPHLICVSPQDQLWDLVPGSLRGIARQKFGEELVVSTNNGLKEDMMNANATQNLAKDYWPHIRSKSESYRVAKRGVKVKYGRVPLKVNESVTIY